MVDVVVGYSLALPDLGVDGDHFGEVLLLVLLGGVDLKLVAEYLKRKSYFVLLFDIREDRTDY